MSPPPFDPRVTPARPDLAAESLRGKVEAARFVAGEAFRIVAPTAPLRRAPDVEAPLDTEALYGEAVVVYEARGDWRWAQLARDGYVGYLPAAALGPPRAPTHRSPRSNPRLSRTVHQAAAALRVVVRRTRRSRAFRRRFCRRRRRLVPLRQAPRADRRARARFRRRRRALSRDALSVGRAHQRGDRLLRPGADRAAWRRESPRRATATCRRRRSASRCRATTRWRCLRRGDLVFWKGHVGIMRDAATLLHANGWAMKVASEPLAEARARIEKSGGGAITSIRRL